MKHGLGVEIYGNGCDAALICGLLASRGEKVVWHLNTPRWSFRPQKLHSKTHKQILSWLSEKSRRVDFLLTSPEIQGWKIGEGSYSYDFPFLGSELSRWTDEQSLFNELKSLAKELGVLIKESERFPAPDWSDSKFRILACDTDPLIDWPRGLFSRQRVTQKIEVCETIYPNDPLSPNAGRIYHLSGVQGVLEPRSATEASLSLYHTNLEPISRCLRTLQNPLSSAPSYLRALCMQNMGAKRRFATLWHGRSPIDPPGLAIIGSALGQLHPVAGLDLEHKLQQAFLMAEHFEASREKIQNMAHGVAEHWNQKSQKRFNNQYKSSLLWVKGLSQTKFCRQTVATATLLPQFLREALKSPL